jgi:hypothetical protein
VRAVNVLYLAHPEPRPSVYGDRWTQLESELDAAFASGDDNAARAAVVRWEKFACYALGSPKR